MSWRDYIPINLPINNLPADSDEENYQSTEENDPNNLVSPRRPHQSPTASPRALLRPDPPPVDEILASVDDRLQNLPARDQRAERRNAQRQALEAAEAEAAAAEAEAAAAAAAATANMPDVVDFDQENGQDGAKASELGRQIKVEFSTTDIRFWFAELEAEMSMATIKGQWLKKTVLQRNLPVKQKEDVKALLTLTQTQAGENIYFRIKNELKAIKVRRVWKK